MYLKSRDNKSANIPEEFFVRKFPCVFTSLTSGYIFNTASPSETFSAVKLICFLEIKKKS